MASVSGATSSLGNTALRGFGGLVTGMDRDSLIEQLTAGTAAKITKQKMAMTKLTWKQDAFRSISGKILDLQDNFLDYSASKSLRDAAFFSKSQITASGSVQNSKYVKASGTSSMVDHLSIMGVKQLATSAQRFSDEKKVGDGSIKTGVTQSKFESGQANIVQPNLKGMKLTFGTYDASSKKFNEAVTFTFPSSYVQRDQDGKPVEGASAKEIDYTQKPEDLVKDLNAALKDQQFLSDKAGKSGIEFFYDSTKDQISIKKTADISKAGETYMIQSNSSALQALGYDGAKLSDTEKEDGLTLDEFNKSMGSFNASYLDRKTLKEYLVGKSIDITFGGQTKTIELIKEDEKDQIKTLADLQGAIQKRLNRVFGTDKVTADTVGGALSFKTTDSAQTLKIHADSIELRKHLGIEVNQSNKISMDASLYYNREVLFGFSSTMTEAEFTKEMENFEINGVKLKDITAGTTVNQLMDKINSNNEIGVRATYMDNTSQFVLISKETGSGRKIDLGTAGSAADKLFGTKDEVKNNKDGEDAQIRVGYGNGIWRDLTSASNTFDLEGLKVTVTNTFGIHEKKDPSGTVSIEYTNDKADEVSFSASADAEKVTERVKKFIEDYNALIKEVNTQVSTKPSAGFKPLTDEQKKEMDKESIENWEKKAKEGILFNNSAIRDLGSAFQGIFAEMMGNGADADTLEKMGITLSKDAYDGGIIKFDEEKFKAAMAAEPEKVSNIFAGGGDVKKGMVQIIEETLTPYATRMTYKNGGSYGRLIEEAGSDKIALSLTKNLMYSQMGEMQKMIDKLNSKLKTEQDRYISQFSRMEVMINQMNSQSGYLSSMMG